MVRLIKPTLKHGTQVWQLKQSFVDHGENKRIHGSGSLDTAESYEAWLAKLAESHHPKDHGWVPYDTYLIMSDDQVVGILQIRHQLNDFLLERGGHIGYAVEPNYRRRGFATQALKLALMECCQLGIDKALVTCDKDNLASAKVIKNNGGVLENEINDEENPGKIIQRWWIKL